MAVAEKVMAEKLCENIFVRYYLPSDRKIMDEILDSLYEKSPRDEAMVRLRLLSAYKLDDQRHQVDNVVRFTAGEIVNLLEPLLFTVDAKERFQSKLEDLLGQAIGLWRLVQKSPRRIVVENTPNQDWDGFRDYDTAVQIPDDQAVHIADQSDTLLSLFPRISIFDDIICPGYALWSSQSIVVAADIEYLQSAPRNITNSRTSSVRCGSSKWDTSRRKASVNDTTLSRDRMEDTSSSPEARGASKLYLDHAISRRISLSKVLGQRTVSPAK